ncbi:MAG: hypothetical protein J6K72_08320 [Clostridia bacterium]|nr:hypothetical protein [Clostridia bacterium]
MKQTGRKTIQVEWCKNWIKSRFAKLPSFANAIERNLLFSEAEKAGLYVRGTFDSSFSRAIEQLLEVEDVHDKNGNFLYYVFRLKKPERP